MNTDKLALEIFNDTKDKYRVYMTSEVAAKVFEHWWREFSIIASDTEEHYKQVFMFAFIAGVIDNPEYKNT